MISNKIQQDIKRNFPKGWRSFINIFTNPGIISIIIYRYLHAVSKMNPALLRVIFLVPGKIIEKIWGDLSRLRQR